MKRLAFFLGVMSAITSVQANDGVLGYWTTIDDETNEPKSIVRVYEHNEKVYGRVVKMLKNPAAKAKLPGEPPIEGLDIIWDMVADGARYEDGEILDPKTGTVYDCMMWLEGENLVVRGKIAFLGRNQTWIPGPELSDDTPLVPQKPTSK